MLHHAIDGFSRLIVFGQFSDNNRAETVHQLCLRAVEKYSCPFRVRTDYGGENGETTLGPWYLAVQFTIRGLRVIIEL